MNKEKRKIARRGRRPVSVVEDIIEVEACRPNVRWAGCITGLSWLAISVAAAIYLLFNGLGLYLLLWILFSSVLTEILAPGKGNIATLKSIISERSRYEVNGVVLAALAVVWFQTVMALPIKLVLFYAQRGWRFLMGRVASNKS